MASVRLSNAAAQAGLNAITALLGSTAVFEVFTGTMPTNCEDAATGTKLCSLSMSSTAFAAATDTNPGAQSTAGAITSAAALATGTAGYARLKTASGGTCVVQGSVGISGDADCLITFNTLSFVSGTTVSVTALYLRLAETIAEA